MESGDSHENLFEKKKGKRKKNAANEMDDVMLN
jgi:hypothetical protein